MNGKNVLGLEGNNFKILIAKKKCKVKKESFPVNYNYEVCEPVSL